MNPRYDLGSVLTVHTVADAMTRGGDVLLMDADVLYDERIMSKLVAGETVNRLLIDRDFEAGDEPVKLCLKDGVPVELRKQLMADLVRHDRRIGRLLPLQAGLRARLAEIVKGYVDGGRANMPHEEAVRDLLLERSHVRYRRRHRRALDRDRFPGDVARAAEEVLPQLLPVGIAQ
jgi:hypothetical protein